MTSYWYNEQGIGFGKAVQQS